MEGKYVVFKREDWEAFCSGMGEEGVHNGGTRGVYITDLVEEMVPDAVVIRRQDVFAPPALDMYANGIMVAIEVSGEDSDIADLRELADYFHSQAEMSWNTDRKIPD